MIDLKTGKTNTEINPESVKVLQRIQQEILYKNPISCCEATMCLSSEDLQCKDYFVSDELSKCYYLFHLTRSPICHFPMVASSIISNSSRSGNNSIECHHLPVTACYILRQVFGCWRLSVRLARLTITTRGIRILFALRTHFSAGSFHV